VAFAPDGKTLASTNGGTLRFWDLATGKLLPETGRLPASVQITYSPDGKLLAGDGVGPKPNLYDCEAGKPRYRGPFSYPALPVVFSTDGRLLATAGQHTLRVWDLAAEKAVWPLEGHQGEVESVTFVQNGAVLVSAALGNMGHYHLWESATGKQLVKLEQVHASANSVGWPVPTNRASGVSVAALASSPDGKILAVGSGGPDGTIWLVDAATGKEIRKLVQGKNWVMALASSADGRTLLSQHGATLCLWDVRSGKQLRSFEGSQAGQDNIALAPDGNTVAQGDFFRGMVHLWDAATGKELRQLAGHKQGVQGVTFSPDGKLLASVGGDSAVFLWDVATGKLLHRLEGTRPWIRFAAFSPDGRSIVSGGLDRMVRVWEVASGGERQRFQGHRAAVRCGRFSPDGRLVATGSGDTTVLVWDLFRSFRGEQEKMNLEAAWSALGEADARQAFRAIVRLLSVPGQSLAFLKERLVPVVAADPKELAPLLADLDSEQFAVRGKAARELEKLGESARPALHKLQSESRSAEGRRRAQQLLDKLEGPTRLRAVRAMEVLEHLGTPEARRFLQRLAGGIPEARLTQEAKMALERLDRRPPAEH
jgi:WD40 repeat protein